jgi:hypothetical protein
MGGAFADNLFLAGRRSHIRVGRPPDWILLQVTTASQKAEQDLR